MILIKSGGIVRNKSCWKWPKLLLLASYGLFIFVWFYKKQNGSQNRSLGAKTVLLHGHNLLPGLHLYCRGLGWSVIYTCKWTDFMNISSKKFLSLLYSIIHKIGQRRSLIYNPFSQIYVSVPKKALLLEEHWFLMTQIACLYLGWENWPCQIYILCPGWWFTSAKCQTN